MILDETYPLANGVTIPKLGLGTWFIDDGDAPQAVRDAVAIGYRHLDTAQAYGNEHGVGVGVRDCGVPRDQLFVTTKLAAEIKEHDAAVAAIDESLQRLGLEYIDLMLIHCPQPWNDYRGGDYAEGNREAWRALEEAHRAGKIRAIGVSNFLLRYFGKPVLILHGEHDLTFPVSVAQRLHDALPGSDLVVLPGCGHQAQFECPQPWAAAVTRFLRDER